MNKQFIICYEWKAVIGYIGWMLCYPTVITCFGLVMPSYILLVSSYIV